MAALNADVMSAADDSTNAVQKLTDLPADLLRAVGVRVLRTRDFVWLCRTCWATWQCCDDSLVAARAQSIGGVPGSASLELMALHEEFKFSLLLLEEPDRLMDLLRCGCYSSQVGFEFGGKMLDSDDGVESGICNSRGRIQAVAEMLHMHPSATAVIEGHVGITAPAGVAAEYSAARGAFVAAVLVWQHNIDVARLRVRAWGKRLCRRASRSDHPNGDIFRSGYGPGEIFLELGGTVLPRRPNYYPLGDDELNGSACETISGQSLAAKVSRINPIAPAPLEPVAMLAGGRRAGLGSDALRAMIRAATPASLPAPGTIPDHSSGDDDDGSRNEEEGSDDDTDGENDDESSQGEGYIEVVVEEGSEEIARLVE